MITVDHKRLDWNAIPLFLAVSRAGRLTVAARNLGIDHSTLARKLSGLETSLQAKLFNRHASGYTLTSQGQRLLELALELEGQVVGIVSEVGGSDRRVAGQVRVGAPDGFGTRFLASRLSGLTDNYPDLDVELVTIPRLSSLSRDELDMAVSLICPSEGRVHARRLCNYELGLYASSSLLAEWPCSDLDDLSGAPFIGYVWDGDPTEGWNSAAMLPENVRWVLRSANILTQLSAACSGSGFCILPSYIANQEPVLQRVLKDRIRLTQPLWLLTQSDLRGLAKIRVTADFLVSEVQHHRHIMNGSDQEWV